MDIKPLELRLAALKQEAQSWQSTWKDIQTYIKPTRGFFAGSMPNQGKALDSKTVLDGSPGKASRILAAGMTSGLTSPSRPWFKCGISNSALMTFEPVKIWLDTVEKLMMSVFAKSNIYGMLHSMYEDIGPFGTAAAILLEDHKVVMRGRAFTCGEYYLGTGPDNRVNTFGRVYHLPVGALFKEFGLANVTARIKSMYDNHNVDAWVTINHLIEPNDTRIMDAKDNKNMAFRSVYWEAGTNEKTLRETGFDEFPVIAPRWDTTSSSDIYGKSPGWDALGDAKMLQALQRKGLIALDKVIDPPLQTSATISGAINTVPGGITRYSGQPGGLGLAPVYQITPDLNAIEAKIDRTAYRIDQTFYADLFLMISQMDKTGVTAREVVERHEEKLLMLGPVLNNLKDELLDPLFDRLFAIMLRANILPPIPRELQGIELKIEYISMLAQAQKMVGTTALEQYSSFVGNLAAVKPEVLDIIDFDEVALSYGDMLGVPAKVTRGLDAIAQIRKGRADQEAAAAQQQQAMNMVQGAKVMSETTVGQNSALDAVMTGINGPGMTR